MDQHASPVTNVTENSVVLDQFLSDIIIPAEFFWEGDFAEYLTIVSKQPSVLATANQRMYAAVTHWGMERKRRWKEPLIHYRVFDDPFTPNHENAVYGIEPALMELVNILWAGALDFGQQKRIILLRGPVGTAKSTLGELFASALEAYSRTEEGKLFSLVWTVSDADEEGQYILGTTDRIERCRLECPLHEQPLHIVPKEIRKEAVGKFIASVQELYPYPIKFAKDSCPRCADIFEKFLRRYNANWKKVLQNHVRVKRLLLSRRNGIGIAVTRPEAEKDQDATEWSGETNFVALSKYGSISDPRTFDFKGYFEMANRGMLYSEELLKLTQTFLYKYLGASQEQRIQPKGFQEVDIDEVIFGGTNNPEWEKMLDAKEMEALRDRIIPIPVPYILRWSEEVKIYRKFFTEGMVTAMKHHIAPHTLETAAHFGVISRLKKPESGDLTLREKLKLYDGKQIRKFTDDSVRELMHQAKDEGLESRGMGPRYIHDKLSSAIIDVFARQEKKCVNFFAVLSELRKGIQLHQHLKSDTERDAVRALLAETEEELREILKDEVQQVMVGDEEALSEMHNKYIDNALAYKHGEKLRDPVTQEEVPPDEDFMRGVEQTIGVTDSQKDNFRETILGAMAKRSRERDLDPSVPSFNFRTNEQLLKAYQLKLFEQEKDRINWEALISKKAVGEDAQKRINALREGLINQKGYCEICSAEVITHVASLFHRGEKKK